MQKKIKIYLSLLFILIVFFSCRNKNDTPEHYFCDAELVNFEHHCLVDKYNPNIKYGNIESRSSEISFSGKYSVKLDDKNKFGLSTKIENIKPGERYKISVVRYGNPKAYLVVSSGKNYYEKFGEHRVKPAGKTGWYIIEALIQIPYFIENNELNVYVWNTSNETAYFDDLRIDKLNNFQKYNFKLPALYLYIDLDDMQKLEKIRQKAFAKGILETTDESWVKGSMFHQGNDYKIKLRFKGDWLDHLEGNKWSFRIKVKKGKTWKGMKTFSIQNPKSRHFLDEWFAHKILTKEDVLTTRYDFIPVYLNNRPLGIYAYEEHFEKQLPESRNRREGVILKFSEEQFWATYKVCGNTDLMPVYESADITAFKINKILKNEALYNQFLIAQNLLFEYKYQLKNASEIFDTEKLARYYAALTLLKMNHALRWHNMRFYYNPILCKLEPIAYDGYTTDGYMAWGGNIFGNFEIDQAENSKIENISDYFVFTDSIFRKKYLKYLEIYSSDTFINNRFKENQKQLKFYENELQKEYPDYVYDTSFIRNNAKKIQNDLNIYKLRIKEGKYDKINFKRNSPQKYTRKYYENLIPYFVNVFSENKNNKEIQLKIENYLPFDIQIVGFSKTDLFISEEIHPIKIQKFDFEKNIKNIRTNYTKANYICVKVPGKARLFFIKISAWKAPEAHTPLQLLTRNNILKPENGKQIIFKKKKYTFSKTVIIPKGYEVIFEAGSEINFIQNAGFISFSPVFIYGTKNNKVRIHSADKTAQGFTVLQADKESIITYAVFENLNTLKYKNWTLTGSVNFYESNITLKNTEFIKNHCEDALNTVRSNFNISNCRFENIFGDAFDSDFCTGKLTDSYFNNIGNDALDFSGSLAEIKNCTIKNLNDKGISGGEKSKLNIFNCIISNTKIAVASKDSSVVSLKNCKLENCRYGLVAFKKKAEFGPAKIYADNLEHFGLVNFYLIEKNSVLELNGKKIPENDKNTAKRFY